MLKYEKILSFNFLKYTTSYQFDSNYNHLHDNVMSHDY